MLENPMYTANPPEPKPFQPTRPGYAKWQFLISNSILGPILTGVRRNCRGPWITTDLPKHVCEYLGFRHTNDRRTQSWDPLTLEEYRAEISGGEGVALYTRASLKTIKGWCFIPNPPKTPRPRKIPKRVPAIRSLHDLIDHFGATDARGLNHRLYKDTACGASISIKPIGGEWLHNGMDWSDVKEIEAFSIQTIIEGSDSEINGPDFYLPVTVQEVDDWIETMETEANWAWDEANSEEGRED